LSSCSFPPSGEDKANLSHTWRLTLSLSLTHSLTYLLFLSFFSLSLSLSLSHTHSYTPHVQKQHRVATESSLLCPRVHWSHVRSILPLQDNHFLLLFLLSTVLYPTPPYRHTQPH